MPQLTTSCACLNCGTRVMAVKDGANHGLHLVMTLLTLGFWIPIWILVGLSTMSTSYRCARCGLRVSS